MTPLRDATGIFLCTNRGFDGLQMTQNWTARKKGKHNAIKFTNKMSS